MSVDYDLIVIGATPAGIKAAEQAATLKARVALVTQTESASGNRVSRSDPQVFLKLSPSLVSWQQAQALPIWQTSSSLHSPQQINWSLLQGWMDEVGNRVDASHSLSLLPYQGVDVISESGEFCRKPFPGFIVGDRLLRARAYLLAVEAEPLVPLIDGLETVSYLTTATVGHHISTFQDTNHLVVLGEGKEAVEIAHCFARLGIATTLITTNSRLLPTADPEIVRLLQAQLEADGVRVLTQTTVTQIQEQSGKKYLTIANQILESDQLILAAGYRLDLTALNLEAMRVRWNSEGIWHNETMQTTNPRIFVCEGQDGQDHSLQLAIQKAMLAANNALFFSFFRSSDRAVPVTIQTMPNTAWVGPTEPQAIEQFGKNVIILRRSFNTLKEAQLKDDLTGFCKILVRRDGAILAGHGFGSVATEVINLIALAIQQKLKIQTLSKLLNSSSLTVELIQQLSTDYAQIPSRRRDRLRDKLDNIFSLLRFWSS